MKTLKSILVLCVAMATLIGGCKKDAQLSTNEKKQLKVSDFKQYGMLHNAFLKNAKDNFIPNSSIQDLNQKIEYISQFNINFLNQVNGKVFDKNILKDKLEQNKHYLSKDYLSKKLFVNGLSKNNKPNIYDMLDELRSKKTMSIEAYDILKSLSKVLEKNYYNELSNEKLERQLHHFKDEYDKIGFVKTSQEGKMLGVILSVSLHSMEWWRNNPDAIGDEKIAPWIASDIAGAIVGGVVSGLRTGSWSSAGEGAIIGGAIASVGVIGKLSRFISSWF